jgi:uncharacterized transporter YbjL
VEWLVHTLRQYPELAIFLTLGLGYFIGKKKFGNFSLGAVTGTLLAGVVIGQLHIIISPNVKSVFFLFFLFAVGYGVGPQFFRGLKSDGLPQVLFAVLLCLACLFSTYLAAVLLGFGVGWAAGLLSGACTISAVIGVATDTINQLAISAEQKATYINQIPVAYAVTYIFGTAGSAWFLASVGPELLGVDLPAACKELEQKMGAGQPEAGVISAYSRLVARAYQLTNPNLVGKTLADFEAHFSPRRVFVERVRQGGKILAPSPELVLKEGDALALGSIRAALLEIEPEIGPELDDWELLDFRAESLDVVVTNKTVDGKTLQEIAESDAGRQGRGVFLRKLMRGGQEMPFTLGTTVDRGDVLTIAGAQTDVERAAKLLGYADRPTDMTDEDNIIDKMIAGLPAPEREITTKRYEKIALDPAGLKFIDRLVADSRDVALNHTAGLSLPQQAQMQLFSLFQLMDQDNSYQESVMKIVAHRVKIILEGLGIDVKIGPYYADYYGLIDFEFWLKKYVDEGVVQFIKENYDPLDIVFRLAEDHAIVLLNGGGFDAPDWSVRVSFANLPDAVYEDIGRAVQAVARGYVEAYRHAQGGKDK